MATIKDLIRMCKETKCKDCPLSGGTVDDCWVFTLPDSYPDEDIDAIVDKWVSEHPVKTYLQDFFEKFPNAMKEESGEPIPCIGTICSELYGKPCPVGKCFECWNQEME